MFSARTCFRRCRWNSRNSTLSQRNKNHHESTFHVNPITLRLQTSLPQSLQSKMNSTTGFLKLDKCFQGMTDYVLFRPSGWINCHNGIRFIRQPRVFHTSSQQYLNAIGPTSIPKASGVTYSRWWHHLARAIRIIRIPVLVVSVYSLGYQQGIIDCTKTPEALHDQIMASILVGVGVRNTDSDKGKIKVLKESDVSIIKAYTEPHYKIAVVGQRIINSARELVDQELQKAITATNATLPADISPTEANRVLNSNVDVQFWYNAKLRLDGEHVRSSKPWRYIIVDSPEPNAFVSEILPHRFFITTSMLELANTSDELAFILGHEISHLILGHISNMNQFETMLRTIEILLISLDPTAGLLSITFISFLYAIRKVLAAQMSRDNEMQADELGLTIAARACFNTMRGVNVMYKMYQQGLGPGAFQNTESNSSTSTSSSNTLEMNRTNDVLTSSAQVAIRLMDSHPPTLERFERMKQLASLGENYTKYDNCCNAVSRFFKEFTTNSNTSTTKSKSSSKTV